MIEISFCQISDGYGYQTVIFQKGNLLKQSGLDYPIVKVFDTFDREGLKLNFYF